MSYILSYDVMGPPGFFLNSAIRLLHNKEHYKMSNENFKHHENRGKVYGRSKLYIERCQCDILLFKSTAPLSLKIILLYEICTKIMHN